MSVYSYEPHVTSNSNAVSSINVNHANLYIKGVGNCKEGGPGLKLPQILSPCYNVYKQLLKKDIQNLEKQERKKHLSGYI